jgi:hypothetical protein
MKSSPVALVSLVVGSILGFALGSGAWQREGLAQAPAPTPFAEAQPDVKYRAAMAAYAEALRLAGRKWEYAILSYDSVARKASWQTSKEYVEANHPYTLYQKLAGKKIAEGINNESALLGYLGQQGWELATHTYEGTQGIRTFKRPAR